jgi:hypothetical protein
MSFLSAAARIDRSRHDVRSLMSVPADIGDERLAEALDPAGRDDREVTVSPPLQITLS